MKGCAETLYQPVPTQSRVKNHQTKELVKDRLRAMVVVKNLKHLLSAMSQRHWAQTWPNL